MQLALVLNPAAGTLRGLDAQAAAERLAEIFRAEGHTVSVDVRAGAAALEAIREICEERKVDAVVVGGGDGTVSAAAGLAAAGGVALGVLPLGTMNLFARSIGLPLDMEAAARALAGGRINTVDFSEVNGRVFVHHLTLGLHPRMIRIRERMRYGSRWGKILANVQALFIAIRQPPRLRLDLVIDGARTQRRTAALLVTNNPLGEGHIPYADDLRSGKLGVYLSRSWRWTRLLRLAAALTMGDISHNPNLEYWLADTLDIHPPRPVITASLDGEIVSLERPLEVRLRRRGLRVLQPAAELHAPDFVHAAKGVRPMTENLNKTEARQGDRRRMNLTVVFIGLPLAFALLAFLAWALGS